MFATSPEQADRLLRDLAAADLITRVAALEASIAAERRLRVLLEERLELVHGSDQGVHWLRELMDDAAPAPEAPAPILEEELAPLAKALAAADLLTTPESDPALEAQPTELVAADPPAAPAPAPEAPAPILEIPAPDAPEKV